MFVNIENNNNISQNRALKMKSVVFTNTWRALQLQSKNNVVSLAKVNGMLKLPCTPLTPAPKFRVYRFSFVTNFKI